MPLLILLAALILLVLVGEHVSTLREQRRTDAVLQEILTTLHAQSRQGEILMAKVTDIDQLITDLDTETTAVAAKLDAQLTAIAALQAQIAAGSPATQADLDAIAAGLTPISARLKALGSDPTNPIPSPVV